MAQAAYRPMGRPVGRPIAHGIAWPIWWVTFLSLTGFNLAVGISAVLMAGFLLTWILYFLAWPARGLDRMARTLLPWAFPLLATASSLWSSVPGTSLRNGLQLLVVTGIGILIARAQSARSFTAALMGVMLVSVVVGTALGGTAAIGIRGDSALVGIFGSKNNFAMMVSFMLLAAITVLPDRRQPVVLRLIALLCCLLAPPYMVLTKSVGGIITLGLALGAFGIFALAARLPVRARPGFYAGILLLACCGLGMFLLLEDSGILEEVLRSFGKDTTLTGRTFLWQRAAELIGLNPLLGVGYQAFWVQESVEAEGLWRLGKNTARSGFHLHSLYYATAVELGYVGFAVLGTTLVTLTLSVLVNACRRPSLELAFGAAVVVIFASRAFVELDFISPFNIGTLLIPILWGYGTQQPAAVYRPVLWHARPGVRHLAAG